MWLSRGEEQMEGDVVGGAAGDKSTRAMIYPGLHPSVG